MTVNSSYCMDMDAERLYYLISIFHSHTAFLLFSFFLFIHIISAIRLHNFAYILCSTNGMERKKRLCRMGNEYEMQAAKRTRNHLFLNESEKKKRLLWYIFYNESERCKCRWAPIKINHTIIIIFIWMMKAATTTTENCNNYHFCLL